MSTIEIISLILFFVFFLTGFVPVVMGIVYYARENRRLDREEKERRQRTAPSA